VIDQRERWFELAALPDAIATARVIMAPLVVGAFMWFVVQSENGVRHWCDGLIGAPRLYRLIGDHWIAVAVPFFLLMGAALIYGSVSELAERTLTHQSSVSAVVDHYDKGGIANSHLDSKMFKLSLTAQEKAALVKFMAPVGSSFVSTTYLSVEGFGVHSSWMFTDMQGQ